MGLEKEKSDTSIIMGEDEFNRSIEPILGRKAYIYPPVPDRDPKDINAHLKVDFEDVIAEPVSTRSLDRVWICSHAVFELVKYGFYRFLTTFLALPVAFVLGVVFGTLSCIHIWVVMPGVRGCMMALPPMRMIWFNFMEMFVGPLFFSLGRCLSFINIKTKTEN